jgi:hypothetical protein
MWNCTPLDSWSYPKSPKARKVLLCKEKLAFIRFLRLAVMPFCPGKLLEKALVKVKFLLRNAVLDERTRDLGYD